jgi:hypothetical protein
LPNEEFEKKIMSIRTVWVRYRNIRFIFFLIKINQRFWLSVN